MSVKVRGRYIWAAVVAIGVVSSAVTTYHQESGVNRSAAITDAVVPLVVGWIIYWVGVAIYRTVANRGKSPTLPVVPGAVESRQRKKYRMIIIVAVVVVVVVVGFVIGRGTGPDLSKQATLSDYYPCLDATKAQQALKAGGAPSQTLINALISTGKMASDPQIRKGATLIAKAYRTPISNNAGVDVVAGIGTILERCNALQNLAP